MLVETQIISRQIRLAMCMDDHDSLSVTGHYQK